MNMFNLTYPTDVPYIHIDTVGWIAGEQRILSLTDKVWYWEEAQCPEMIIPFSLCAEELNLNALPVFKSSEEAQGMIEQFTKYKPGYFRFPLVPRESALGELLHRT
jgi:hypothetical protein